MVIEKWTINITECDAEKKVLKFALNGSATGPDGEGDASKRFVSDSGRVARWLRLDVMPEGSLLPARVLLPAAVLLLMGLGILATLRRSHRQAADPLREPEPARQ